jgi:hypothetical protein
VPLGALLLLAVLRGEALVRREREVRNGLTALRVAKLGISPEVADQDHFVDARHALAPSVWGARAIFSSLRASVKAMRAWNLIERSLK